ncbi:MAG TPA: FG-GAP-like repeat-containing protein, partial [candidate division Zixibacteria bacterium]|nr:FG-GAP-like repeat-containing protein [candidate division Zixibacteria bacterium]
GNTPYSVATADLDGDGDCDLAVANYGSHSVSILRNNGDGTFTVNEDYATGHYPRSVCAADLDGDGDSDLATVNYDSTVSILRNLTVNFPRKGDLNGDYDLTPADVVLMLSCVFLGSGDCVLAMADVDCNGNLSPSDVVVELNAVFQGIPFPC